MRTQRIHQPLAKRQRAQPAQIARHPDARRAALLSRKPRPGRARRRRRRRRVVGAMWAKAIMAAQEAGALVERLDATGHPAAQVDV